MSRAHARRTTPNPCIECNRSIKFDRLAAIGRDRLGFDRLAHQPSRSTHGRRAPFTTAAGCRCRERRQSYVLSMLGQAEAPAEVMFPSGEMTKSAVRAHAVRLGLRTAGKPDSQDVCFIGSVEGRQGFLADKLEFHPASVTERSEGETGGIGRRGRVGDGRPAPRYGARQADGARRYVVGGRRPDPTCDGGRSAAEAMISALVLPLPGSLSHVESTNPSSTGSVPWPRWPPGRPAPCARRRPFADSGLIVRFDMPQRPVAPGQTVALYDVVDPDAVVGAGIAA